MKTIYVVIITIAFIGMSIHVSAWNSINSGTINNLTSVCFTDENTGFAVGTQGTILKTINAGQTWTTQTSGTLVTLNSVFFIDSYVGYAVGGTTILKTIDGGQNWTIQICSATTVLKSVYFISPTIGYAVGLLGVIIKTNDGGNNWNVQTTPITNSLLSVSFIDNNTGFIVGGSGKIIKTEDAGVNWFEISSGTTSGLNSIYFQNSSNGYITSNSGDILKTTDGGLNWTLHSTGFDHVLYGIYFIDNNIGYIASRNILKTFDGGITWTEQSVSDYGLCLSVCFVNDSIGFAVGGSGLILKTYIGGGYSGNEVFSANNISALFHSNGNLFFDLPNGGAEFEVPSGSGKSTIFTGGLWIGGIDNFGELHLSCEKYRQNGSDYFAGPVMDSIYYLSEQEKWNRIWTISKSEIINHILHWNNSGYITPSSILEWPANGNISMGQLPTIAPYFDYNGDGYYNPLDGDYPLIKGDNALFFVYNDDIKEHTESDAEKLKIEIHAMVYAFNCPQDSAFWNTMFIDYEIINRSQATYNSAFIGAFMDFDIGDPNDDYIGCDVKRGSFYAYNGDSIDGSGAGNSYGTYPPAQAVCILGGPNMDDDGSDFGSSGIAGGCDESINGLNFNDGIIDNERLGMTRFMYFNNSTGSMGDPNNAIEHYNVLKGYWRNGVQITYGGTGYDSLNQSTIASFMYPGQPSSDLCGWGTEGVPQLGWSENTEQNSPADRRGLASMGPFTMLPGETNKVELAFAFGRQYTNPDPSAAIQVVQQRIDSIRHGYLNNVTPCGPFNIGVNENNIQVAEINIYPNPASCYFTIELQNNNENKTVSVYTMDGVLVKQQRFSTENTQIEAGGLSAGLYIVEVRTNKDIFKKKLMIVR